MADTDRLDEIKARIVLRHNNDEDHSPIDVHKAVNGVIPEPFELLHQLCIECSDDDTIAALENGELIDASAGVTFPCAAADVDWLVAEVERLRAKLAQGAHTHTANCLCVMVPMDVEGAHECHYCGVHGQYGQPCGSRCDIARAEAVARG